MTSLLKETLACSLGEHRSPFQRKNHACGTMLPASNNANLFKITTIMDDFLGSAEKAASSSLELSDLYLDSNTLQQVVKCWEEASAMRMMTPRCLDKLVLDECSFSEPSVVKSMMQLLLNQDDGDKTKKDPSYSSLNNNNITTVEIIDTGSCSSHVEPDFELDTHCLQGIIHGLQDIPQLQNVKFSRCNLVGFGPVLEHWLAQDCSSSLQSLTLECCRWSPSDIAHFIQELARHREGLCELDLNSSH